MCILMTLPVSCTVYSTRYTVLQMKNSTRNFSTMNPVAMENAGEKHDTFRGKLYRVIANRHLVLLAKRTGTQRRTKVGL